MIQSIETTATQSQSNRNGNRQIVAALFERLTRLDIDGFLALFTEDGRQVMPYAPDGFPSEFNGLENLETIYRQLFGGYRRVNFPTLEIEDLVDPNRFLATYTTDIDLVDGRHYANRYIATFTLRDQRIAEWVEYFNPFVLQSSLGNPFEKQ